MLKKKEGRGSCDEQGSPGDPGETEGSCELLRVLEDSFPTER